MQANAKRLVPTGQPIDEPVAAHRPFVMNSADEIRQAVGDPNRIADNLVWPTVSLFRCLGHPRRSSDHSLFARGAAMGGGRGVSPPRPYQPGRRSHGAPRIPATPWKAAARTGKRESDRRPSSDRERALRRRSPSPSQAECCAGRANSLLARPLWRPLALFER
jgi:pirin-like protein